MTEAPREPRRRRRPLRGLRAANSRLPLLGLLVLGSVLALGSQHVWALLPLGVVATVLAAVSVEGVRRTPKLAWLMAALVVYTLLQLVPLPAGMVARLSPAASAVWTDAAKALGEPGPLTMSLSVDPQATALEALKWWIYLATFIGAAALRRSRGPTALASVLFVSTALVAVLTLLHGAFDWQRVYGLYPPSFPTQRWQRGPLLNGNNLAGYLNLGLGVTAGLMASGRDSLPRWLLTLGALAMATGVLLSGSRGGLLVMVLLVVGFCAALIWSSGLDLRSRRLSLGALALTLVAAAGALAVAGDRLLADWLGQDFSRKVAAWGWTIDLIRHYPWFGVGRGAFETAFPMYRGYLGHDWTSLFAHPENLALQWLAEWGLLVGGAALVGLAWVVSRLVRRSLRARLTLGVALGCSAVLLQNAVDLSSEIAGVMLAVVVGLAALGGSEQEVSRPEVQRWPAVGLGLVGAALVLVAFALGRYPAREERALLSAEYRGAGGRDHFQSSVHAAIWRHPADPYLPLLAGLSAQRAGDRNALAWLGHALALGPTTGTVHLALADVLAARGAASQALLHLRLASQYDATLRSVAVTRAARWARDVDSLERAFPDGPSGVDQLTLACPRLGTPALVIECWRRVGRRSSEVSPLEALAENLALAVRANSAPCESAAAAACVAEVAEIARQVLAKDQPSWRVHAVNAELNADLAEKRRAARELVEHCPGGIDGEVCLRKALSLARAAGDTDALRRAIDRFLGVACSGDAECAAAHDTAAAEYVSMNAWALGLKHRQEAARSWPSAARWLAVADAALRLRALPTAELALRRAEGFSALADTERTEIERLRAALLATAQATD